ncbi:MAG: J domain-containing protein [Pirellulaceae bacterium]
MNANSFVDFYEILEAHPNASQDTVERLYRYKAQTLHPDVCGKQHIQEFTLLVEAYEALKDKESRSEYDQTRAEHMERQASPTGVPNRLDSDSIDRHKLLSALYFQRRNNMRQPGLGDSTLEEAVGCTPDELNFHLWYFRERGWIRREESGAISITADGVDQIEAAVQRKAEMENRLITDLRFKPNDQVLQPCS